LKRHGVGLLLLPLLVAPCSYAAQMSLGGEGGYSTNALSTSTPEPSPYFALIPRYDWDQRDKKSLIFNSVSLDARTYTALESGTSYSLTNEFEYLTILSKTSEFSERIIYNYSSAPLDAEFRSEVHSLNTLSRVNYRRKSMDFAIESPISYVDYQSKGTARATPDQLEGLSYEEDHFIIGAQLNILDYLNKRGRQSNYLFGVETRYYLDKPVTRTDGSVIAAEEEDSRKAKDILGKADAGIQVPVGKFFVKPGIALRANYDPVTGAEDYLENIPQVSAWGQFQDLNLTWDFSYGKRSYSEKRANILDPINSEILIQTTISHNLGVNWSKGPLDLGGKIESTWFDSTFPTNNYHRTDIGVTTSYRL
jgi:hypothetical protein